MEILFSKDVEKFISKLQKSTIAKVFRTVNLLERFEYKLGAPHAKKMREDLFELRIRGEQEIRIFYSFYENKIILLHGFVKKTLKTPKKELDLAIKKLHDLT